MLVAASPYHLPQSGTVVLSNVPPNLAPSHLVPLVPIAIQQGQGQANHHKKRYNDQETEALVQKALREAWERYGPKTPYGGGQNLPPSGGGAAAEPWVIPPAQFPHHANPQSFQTLTSEWDTRMTAHPVRNRQPLEPGPFNVILSKYIDMEVNHAEFTEVIRRVFFWILIGALGIGWIFLGLAIGLIPFHIFGWGLGKRNLEGKLFTDTSKSGGGGGGGFGVGNDIVREITERVFLALDGDWLRQLEQKVKKGSNGRWLKTSVHCCIMPDAKAKGTAECQLIRRARKVQSPFKCLSDLIYDIQFGPADTISTSSPSAKSVVMNSTATAEIPNSTSTTITPQKL